MGDTKVSVLQADDNPDVLIQEVVFHNTVAAPIKGARINTDCADGL